MALPRDLILLTLLAVLLTASGQPALAGKIPNNNSDEENVFNALQNQANQQAQGKQTPAPPNPGPDSQPSGPPREGPPPPP